MIDMETTKELSVHMQMYLEYEGDRTLEELENEFYNMIDEFSEKYGVNYQIYDTKLQEV